MRDIVSVIRLIESTSSYNDKLTLLKKYEHTKGLKEVLKFIYNPYCKTGISDAKLNKSGLLVGSAATKSGRLVGSAATKITWYDAITYFSAHQTGTVTDISFAYEFISYTMDAYGIDAAKLARSIVTQNLKIGITATSLNKVYGASFIPRTGCMLGTLFGDVPAHKIMWPCIVTEKLDGIRRILIKENGVCRFYSRSGHEDTGLIEIAEEAKLLPDNFMYDGELLAIGNFKNCIAQRQATNSIANSKGNKTGLTFNVFDMVPIDDFYNGVCRVRAADRKIRLGATLMDESIMYLDDYWQHRIICFGVHEELKFIKPVPVLGVVKSLDEVTPIVSEIWTRGGEGVMLNTLEGPYEVKRSKALLKVKHTEEHILPVFDAIEGSGKFEDSLGAIVVLYTDRHGRQSYLGVGSGFTDAQRKEIWDHPARYIGRMVEIECFGESTNTAGTTSLNCPIFKRFVGEEE